MTDIKVESYTRRDGEQRIEINIGGGVVHSLSKDEARQLLLAMIDALRFPSFEEAQQ